MRYRKGGDTHAAATASCRLAFMRRTLPNKRSVPFPISTLRLGRRVGMAPSPRPALALLVAVALLAVAHGNRPGDCGTGECGSGKCDFVDCASPVTCRGGLCTFTNCKSPSCTGGRCVFHSCEYPTCPGGLCEFHDTLTTLETGYCTGGKCKVDGYVHRVDFGRDLAM